MEDKDVDNIAFVTHHKMFRYTRMPFGIKNTPATFQGSVDVNIASQKWQVAIVNTDNTIIFSKSLDWHLSHTGKVKD